MGKVLLYSGEEEFLKNEELEILKNTYGEKIPIFNFSPQDKEFDIGNILRLARTKNLFSPYQIIVIKEIEKLSPQNGKFLLYYIRNPSEFTDLVLFTKLRIKKFNSDNSWLKILIKEPNIKIKEFSPLSGEELRRWIVKQVKRNGKIISSLAINFLITKLGNEILSLYQAIEKACFYIKDKKIIEWMDLEPIIGKEISSDIYKMLDALLNKDLKYSLKILRDLQEIKERPDRIMGIFVGELKKIFLAKKLIQRGLSEAEIKRELNLYYAEKFFSNLKKISSEKINKSLQHLLFIDYTIKTGKIEPFFAIESWMLEFFS